MGFGGPAMPTPDEAPNVPQEDDPNALIVEQDAQKRSMSQDGYSNHLLSGSSAGVTSSAGTKRKSLVG